MTKNKSASLFVAAILALSCAACSSGGTNGNAQQPATEQTAEQWPVAEKESEQNQDSKEDAPVSKESVTVDEDAGSGNYVGAVPDTPQPYVKEACWWTSQSNDNYSVHITALMGNTDSVNCYVNPKIVATAYGKDGTILGAETLHSEFIAPADVMPSTTIGMDVTQIPARVDFDIQYGKGAVPGHPYTLASFDIRDASEQQIDENNTRWTGKYTNGCGVDFEFGCTTYVLLREDGKLVGCFKEGGLGSGEVPDGATNTISIDSRGDVPEHDSFEIYVVPYL